MVADGCSGVGRQGHGPGYSVGCASGWVETGRYREACGAAGVGDHFAGGKSGDAVTLGCAVRAADDLTIYELQREVVPQLHRAEEQNNEHEMGGAAAHNCRLFYVTRSCGGVLLLESFRQRVIEDIGVLAVRDQDVHFAGQTGQFTCP